MTIRHLTAAVLLAGAALPAQAAYIQIHDDGSSINLIDGQFESGFSANGNLLSTGFGNGSLTIAHGTTLTFTGTWVTYGQAAGSYDIFVVSAPGDTNAIAHLSGSVTTNGATSTITGTYLTGGVYSITGGSTIVAGNSADFSFAFSGNTLFTAEVPEPAMLGLFGLGAIGLGLARRRRA